MARNEHSLLPNRSAKVLEPKDQTNVYNTFLGLDNTVNVKYEAGSKTCFKVTIIDGEEVGEIIVGPDIFPGQDIVNPNAMLSMEAAAAHEVSHFHRWRNNQEIMNNDFQDLDEALTSLTAIMRFNVQLGHSDQLGLVADAMQRITKFLGEHGIE